VHDFVFETGRHHAGRRRFRAFLIAHGELDFRPDGFLVKLQGLFASAVEEEVSLYDWISFCAHNLIDCLRFNYTTNGWGCSGQVFEFFFLLPARSSPKKNGAAGHPLGAPSPNRQAKGTIKKRARSEIGARNQHVKAGLPPGRQRSQAPFP
jgi:hypothetical protein